MERVKVILVDLPHTIRGLTTYCMADDGDDFFTIFINSRLSHSLQCEVYDHEIKHINNRDFNEIVSIHELECLRHAI